MPVEVLGLSLCRYKWNYVDVLMLVMCVSDNLVTTIRC